MVYYYSINKKEIDFLSSGTHYNYFQFYFKKNRIADIYHFRFFNKVKLITKSNRMKIISKTETRYLLILRI